MQFIVPIHICFVIFSFYQVIRSDHYGSGWVFGKVDKLDHKKLKSFHDKVWIGLAGVIITGLTIVFNRQGYIYNPVFQTKMFFVVCLFLNSFVISKLMILAERKSFRSLSKTEKTKIFLSGSVSTISWISAVICATFL